MTTQNSAAEIERLAPKGCFSSAALVAKIFRHPMGAPGATIVLVTFVIALFAPLLAPFDPAMQDRAAELASPSSAHLLGTDQFGRDLLSRIIYGSRVALFVGITATFIGGGVGVFLGLLSGYYGGWIDSVIMRAADVILAFPGILLALFLVIVMGPGMVTVSLALAVGSVPVFARLTRASALQIKQREYVQAAKTFGASDLRIMVNHILRNSASPIVVQLSLVVGISVLIESGLSFLGLGIQPPTPSWGAMLNESRSFIWTAPWFVVGPGVALSLFLVGLVLLADALRDVLDVDETDIGGR